jgi:hypothetical protein
MGDGETQSSQECSGWDENAELETNMDHALQTEKQEKRNRL